MNKIEYVCEFCGEKIPKGQKKGVAYAGGGRAAHSACIKKNRNRPMTLIGID